MLVCAFGTFTPYASWGFSIVGHVLDVVFGHYLRIHCVTLAEFDSAWRERHGRVVLFTADTPDPDLAKLLLTSGVPCLAFVDDPEDAIFASAKIRNFSLANAMRISTGYFCALEPVLRSPHVTVFHRDRYRSQIKEFISDILALIVDPVDDEIINRVFDLVIRDIHDMNALTVGDALARQSDLVLTQGAQHDKLAESEHRLITAVADAYRPIFEHREIKTLEWPRELFHSPNEGYGPPEEVSLLGGARFIVWGPYLFLPLGHWRATVEFEVADNFSGNEIEADVNAPPHIVASGWATLPRFGIYRFMLDFTVTNLRNPIEIRFRILKGAIEGRFSLRSVRLTRRGNNGKRAQGTDLVAEPA
jgi:hypothetical protein